MKLLCYLTALSLLVAVQSIITEEDAIERHKIQEKCQNETGVSDKLLSKSLNRQWEDDPKLKQQVLCVSKKRGLMTESGELVFDVWRSQLKEVITNDEEVEKIINECVVKKDTPEETTFNAVKCVQKKTFFARATEGR
ncbi:B1 protein-like isoform X2 [Tenebrio molitor]|uniref:B1 protein-like isoform X2 n=1 Tax=Tenebrio molitor TaxID=7067 RepID=UPI0036246DB4